MSFIAAAVGSSVVGGLIGSDASRHAANVQADAANNAARLQNQQWQTINEQNQPWIQSGQTAIKQLSNMTAPGSQWMRPFTAADLNENLAPNYQWQLDQGLGAAKNAANLQTGLVSGNALKGLQDYAQNFAANAYQNAFNNYNTNQANIFNRLAAIAGIGQTSANNNANVGMQSALNAGNFGTSSAAAQAAGQIGQANAIGGGLNSLGGYATLRGIMGGGGSAPSYGAPAYSNNWSDSGFSDLQGTF